MDGVLPAEVGEAGHEGDEHAAEPMHGEVVDHVAVEVEPPALKHGGDERSSGHGPEVQGEEDQQIHVEGQHHAQGEDDGVQSALQQVGPAAEKEGHHHDRHHQNVRQRVHGVFRKALPDQFVVIEAAEEVEALERKQEEDAGAEVAAVPPQAHPVIAYDLAEREFVGLALALESCLREPEVQVEHGQHQHEAEDQNEQLRRSDGVRPADRPGELSRGQFEQDKPAD